MSLILNRTLCVLPSDTCVLSLISYLPRTDECHFTVCSYSTKMLSQLPKTRIYVLIVSYNYKRRSAFHVFFPSTRVGTMMITTLISGEITRVTLFLSGIYRVAWQIQAVCYATLHENSNCRWELDFAHQSDRVILGITVDIWRVPTVPRSCLYTSIIAIQIIISLKLSSHYLGNAFFSRLASPICFAIAGQTC